MDAKRIVRGYVRVSTEDQAKEGLSLPAQREKLQQYAQLRNWKLDYIYEDAGISGFSIEKRPAFSQLLQDAQTGVFNILIVYKYDRASRSLHDLIETLDILRRANVDFVSISENLDTSTPVGKMMFHIIGSFAEFERDMIRERTMIGKAKAAQQGEWISQAPFGYIWIGEGKQRALQIKEDEAALVRKVFLEYLRLKTVRKVAAKLGLTKDMIQQILNNPFYIGKMRFQKRILPGIHQPIVDIETWKAVYALRRKNLRKITAVGDFEHRNQTGQIDSHHFYNWVDESGEVDTKLQKLREDRDSFVQVLHSQGLCDSEIVRRLRQYDIIITRPTVRNIRKHLNLPANFEKGFVRPAEVEA